MSRWIQPRGMMLLGLSVGTLAMALISGDSLFSLLFYSLTGLAGFAFLLVGSSLAGIRVSRRASSSQARVGEDIEETLRVTRSGFLPRWGVEITDHSTLPGHAFKEVIPAQVRKTWEKTVRTPCLRRGEYLVGPLHIRGLDPFGFFRLERIFSDETRILVKPQIFTLAQTRHPAGILPGGDALHRRSQQVTTNAVSIREYHPGDPFNRIHWPSTAKTGRVMSREYELDPLADIYLMPDMDRAQVVDWMESGKGEAVIYPSTEEYMITITASLAAHYSRAGRSVGLICYPAARECLIADRGERQLARLMEMLAVITARGLISVRDMLIFEQESLPRGATIIVITATARDDWLITLNQLRGKGIDAAVILIDSASFAGRPGTPQLSERLKKLGITCEIISRSDSLPSFFLPDPAEFSPAWQRREES